MMGQKMGSSVLRREENFLSKGGEGVLFLRRKKVRGLFPKDELVGGWGIISYGHAWVMPHSVLSEWGR